MRKRSKRYLENLKKYEPTKRYAPEEALAILKNFKLAKFNESVDVSINLGVDVKKSEQMVRGVVLLPHGSGRGVRVLVFAKGEKEQEARAAGADYVGAEDLVEKIKGGWLEFDKAIATPDMMIKVGPVAKILGPRGLMPNPKVGTVTQDIAKAVREEKAGRVEFRTDKAGIVHAAIGKISFTAEQLLANLHAFVEQVLKAKPATSKGVFMQKVWLSTTMGGPAVGLEVTKFQTAGSRG